MQILVWAKCKSGGKVKGEPAQQSKADWIVFQTLIGDLNFVSKSLRNFQSSQKRPFSLMDMKKNNRILVSKLLLENFSDIKIQSKV